MQLVLCSPSISVSHPTSMNFSTRRSFQKNTIYGYIVHGCWQKRLFPLWKNSVLAHLHNGIQGLLPHRNHICIHVDASVVPEKFQAEDVGFALPHLFLKVDPQKAVHLSCLGVKFKRVMFKTDIFCLGIGPFLKYIDSFWLLFQEFDTFFSRVYVRNKSSV